VPVGHSTTDREHGRIAKRDYKIVTVQAGIVFPHARQAIQITRRTKRIGAKQWATRELVYAVTDLTAEQTTAKDLAAWIRGHWAIENSCIGSATSPTMKTDLRSEPEPDHAP
jgi:hypothetical protein